MFRVPSLRIGRQSQFRCVTSRESTAEKSLRPSVLQKPRKTGKDCTGEIAVKPGRCRTGNFVPEVARLQRVQRTGVSRRARRVHAIQRPAIADAFHESSCRISSCPRAADTDHVAAGPGGEPRERRLADAEFGDHSAGRKRTGAAQKIDEIRRHGRHRMNGF